MNQLSTWAGNGRSPYFFLRLSTFTLNWVLWATPQLSPHLPMTSTGQPCHEWLLEGCSLNAGHEWGMNKREIMFHQQIFLVSWCWNPLGGGPPLMARFLFSARWEKLMWQAIPTKGCIRIGYALDKYSLPPCPSLTTWDGAEEESCTLKGENVVYCLPNPWPFILSWWVLPTPPYGISNLILYS